MRIIVASPSKTGNIWMKNLLAQTYDLKILTDIPGIPFEALQTFIEQGRFEEQSVFHQHFRPTGEFFELIDQVGAHLVTTIRHPYDVFVSLYFYIQRFSHLFMPGTHFYPLVGKPIDHPDVFTYLRSGQDGFGLQVDLAVGWVESRRSILTRYEDLVADTVAEMMAITSRIRKVSRRKVRKAVQANRPEEMRKKNQTLAEHVRKGTSGDWRNHLSLAHLEAINSAHGAKIRRLGYSLHTGPS